MIENIRERVREEFSTAAFLKSPVKHVIGYVYRSKRAIAYVPGDLTMDIHKEILDEVKSLGLKKPIHIFAEVNAGPNGSQSYIFHQILREDI